MLGTLLVAALAAVPPNGRHIIVSGDAVQTYRANQVVATFVLSVNQRDQAAARKLSDDKLAKLVKACTAAGVEARNVLVVDGGLTPDYRGNEIVAYVQHRTVTLTITDLARLDEALSAAVKNGAVPSGAAVLRNTDFQALATKARLAAAASAKERAKGMIEAMGGKLGLPVAVSDQTSGVDGVSAGTFTASPDGAVTAAWATRELTIVARVTVDFDIEAP